MVNDVVKLNVIVDDIGTKISELAELGQDGFKVPLVIMPDELADMTGIPVAPRQQQSNDLLWVSALKTIIYAHEMLEQSHRIFQQIDDLESAKQVRSIIETIDQQFHPCETAIQIYGRLLRRKIHYETPEND